MYSLYFFVFFFLQSNSQITKAQTEQMELMDLSAPEVSDEELEPYDSFVEEVRKGQRGSSNRPIQRVSAKRKLQSDVRQQITTDSKRRKMTNTGKKLRNCLECNRNFARSSGLKRHMMTHTGEKPHNCRTCNRHFTQRSHLNVHIRTHTGEKPYNCEICNQNFSQSQNLETHMRTHNGKKPYNCLECNKNFTSSSNLKRHMRTHTGEEPSNYAICNRNFTDPSNLTRHMRTHSGKKPFNCEKCNKDFARLSELEEHMRTHTGEEQHISRCNESSSDLSHSKDDTMNGIGGKPFNRPIYNRNFTRLRDLEIHNRTHTGEKPLNCRECNRNFTDPSSLMRHMRTRTGEEQHISRCNESSSDLSHSEDDTMNGIGGKPLCCLRCGKRFATSFRLRAHNCSNERKVPLAEINQKLIDNNERSLSN